MKRQSLSVILSLLNKQHQDREITVIRDEPGTPTACLEYVPIESYLDRAYDAEYSYSLAKRPQKGYKGSYIEETGRWTVYEITCEYGQDQGLGRTHWVAVDRYQKRMHRPKPTHKSEERRPFKWWEL